LTKLTDVPIKTGGVSGGFALAPDGRSFAVGATDGSVMVVPFGTGKTFFLLGHKEPVFEIAFTPDGELLLTGGADNRLIVWKLKTREILHNIAAHNGDLKALDVSSDGTLATTGSVADDVRIWRLSDGERIKQFEGHSMTVYDVLFSSNGQQIYSASRDSTVRKWNVKAGHSKATPITLPDTNVALAWSPDRKTLYCAGHHQQLVWIDPQEFKITHRIRAAKSAITSMAVSRQGNIALGERNGRISIWSPNTKSKEPLVNIPEGHEAGVMNIAFTRDGSLLASLGKNGHVYRWDVNTGTRVGNPPTLPPINGVVRTVATHPKLKHIAVASKGHLFLVDATSKIPKTTAPSMGTGGVSSLLYSHDGKHLLVGRDTGDIRVIEPNNPEKPLGEFKIHEGSIRHMSLGPKNGLWTAGDDSFVRHLDATTYTVKQSFNDHKSQILNLAVDPKGTFVATSAEENVTVIRNMKKNDIYWTLRGYTVSHMAFSPNGKQLATVQKRREIVVYDLGIQRRTVTLKGNTTRVNGLAYHPNGKAVFSIDNLGTLRIWEISTGAMVASANAGRGKTTSLSLNTNASLIAVGGMDPRGSAKLYTMKP